jgi:hypothetical protein
VETAERECCRAVSQSISVADGANIAVGVQCNGSRFRLRLPEISTLGALRGALDIQSVVEETGEGGEALLHTVLEGVDLQ